MVAVLHGQALRKSDPRKSAELKSGMDRHLRRMLDESGYGEPGFAAFYDRFRPQAPGALLQLLPTLLETDRLRLVVDLGSGTGLSTRIWADFADEVIGIEPQDAMRDFAEATPTP